jgi:hypothetical protein
MSRGSIGVSAVVRWQRMMCAGARIRRVDLAGVEVEADLDLLARVHGLPA